MSETEQAQAKTVSIIVPCFNEKATLEDIVERLRNVKLGDYQKEIIIVDDGSTDGSAALAKELAQHHSDVQCVQQPRNQGKGAAVRRGFREARGDLVVVQDADLEYDPRDFQQMVALFRLQDVAVVFGSRRMLRRNRGSGILFYSGAQVINAFTNILYGVAITDQFTCYKMVRRSLLERLRLHRNGFEIDAELVAKLLRLHQKVYEVPITYRPRSIGEGKKIRWRDGLTWLWQIIKYRIVPF